jgi:hypothetical protein
MEPLEAALSARGGASGLAVSDPVRRVSMRAATALIGGRALRTTPSVLVPAALGCAPTVNVLGVYFPPWLISAVAGLVVAYATLWWLGRRPSTRSLAQSGLLFCSLTVVAGLLIWWGLFSSF